MASCRMWWLLAALIALMTISLMVACGAKSSHAEATEESSIRPLRVVVILDKTGSAEEHGVPDPDSVTVAPLVEFFTENGGELAIGTIDSASEQPLVRLWIDISPMAPVDSSGRQSNVFLAAKAKAAYRKQLALYQEDLAQRHEKKVRTVGDFWAALNKQLSKPVTDRRTDIRNAVNRGNMFLSEAAVSWAESPRQLAILCTDGEENVAIGPAIAPVDGVTYIIVPGTREGCLAPLKPIRFESLPAAIRHVIVCAGDTTNSSVFFLHGGQ